MSEILILTRAIWDVFRGEIPSRRAMEGDSWVDMAHPRRAEQNKKHVLESILYPSPSTYDGNL